MTIAAAESTTSLEPPEHERSIAKRIVRALVALIVLGSLVVFVWNALATSSARVNATTSGISFFSAGTIDLVQPDVAVDLLFDADGLYPGVETTGCVEIEYRGSIPSSVRLHANRLGGDGLEDFITLHITKLAVDGCPSEEVMTGQTVYTGPLGELWQMHPNYNSAITLDPTMEAGERIVLQAVATVLDDNAAQGLTTEFAITVEARP